MYYQAGFLPSIPSVSNAFIAIYFFVNYLLTGSRKSFYWSAFFITLAALSRLPFSIMLGTVIIFEAIQTIFKRKLNAGKWIALLLSMIIIGLYFLYNHHLQKKYGSIFLNYALPPKNLYEFRMILKTVWTKWIYQYFTKVHYLVFVILIACSLLTILFHRKVLQKIHKQILTLLLLIIAGYLSYSIMMIQQFTAHDYYFLDTFYLPVVLFLILMLSVLLGAWKILRFPVMILFLAAALLIIPRAVRSQEMRRRTGNWDHVETTIQNFSDSKDFLAANHVPEAAKILVIDAYAPNIPFIEMDRTGFSVLTTSRDNIEKALTWDFDYIIIQNEFLLSEVVPNYPELNQRIEPLSSNGKLTLYRLLKEPRKQSLYDFLGVSGKKAVSVDRCTFEAVDSIWNRHWKKIRLTRDADYNGRPAGYVNEKMEYGLTYQLNNSPLLRDSSRLVFFKGYFLRKKDLKGCSLIASVTSGGENLFYNSYDLQDVITHADQWQEVNLFFQVPQITEKNFKFEIYIWNQGGNTLYYNDAVISIY